MAEPAGNPHDAPETLPAFSAGMKRLHHPKGSRTAQTTDDTIRRAIHAHFERERRSTARAFRIVRWSGAIAALLAVVITAWVILRPARVVQPPATTFAMSPADMDANGRVDILDALVLARMVEARDTSMQLDINKDGLVDALDVDAIAMQAVSLSGTTTSNSGGTL